jgi:hypothetical protein
MNKINVMQMVKEEMTRQHKTAADISRGTNRKYATIAGMMKRPTLQVQMLIVLSETLQYNFFRKIAEMLPIENPIFKQNNSTDEQEIAGLKEKLKVLEIENGILKETLKTLASARQ